MEEINSKISKMQLESSKHIGKVEATLKENINDVKRSMEKMRDDLETKIDDAGSNMAPRQGGNSISSEKLHGISA
jgi:protein-arginine kinase activator protein McsA